MIIIIFAVIVCLLLVDFALIGVLPSKIGIWPSLKDFVKGDILIEDTANLSVHTDIEGKYVESMINRKVGYKSLILTPKYLIVKNTRLTSLLNIGTDCIKRIDTKKALLGNKIILHLKMDDEDKRLEFTTKRRGDWIDAFSRIGIAYVVEKVG